MVLGGSCWESLETPCICPWMTLHRSPKLCRVPGKLLVQSAKCPAEVQNWGRRQRDETRRGEERTSGAERNLLERPPKPSPIHPCTQLQHPIPSAASCCSASLTHTTRAGQTPPLVPVVIVLGGIISSALPFLSLFSSRTPSPYPTFVSSRSPRGPQSPIGWPVEFLFSRASTE